MQEFARTAEISTEVAGMGVTFSVHCVFSRQKMHSLPQHGMELPTCELYVTLGMQQFLLSNSV